MTDYSEQKNTLYHLLDVISSGGVVIFEEIHHRLTIRVLKVNVYSWRGVVRQSHDMHEYPPPLSLSLSLSLSLPLPSSLTFIQEELYHVRLSTHSCFMEGTASLTLNQGRKKECNSSKKKKKNISNFVRVT